MPKIYSHKDIAKVFVVGDIHGQFKQFFHKIKNRCEYHLDMPIEKVVNDETFAELKEHIEVLPSHLLTQFYEYDGDAPKIHEKFNNSIIIVAGDCGFGFEKNEYYHQIFGKYLPLLEKNNIFIYFVRGNHDDPSYFSEEKINLPHIKTIPDYSVIISQDYNVLCVGGAVSIDRIWRKQQEFKINKYKKKHIKKLFWENEIPIFSPENVDDILNNDITINAVVTHSAPHFTQPRMKSNIIQWSKMDKNIMEDVNSERNTLTKLYDYLIAKGQQIHFWAFGHFHFTNEKMYNNTIFQALDNTFNFMLIRKNDSLDIASIGLTKTSIYDLLTKCSKNDEIF